MKLPAKTKPILIEIISYLYILLFVYAATSKLLDFVNFRVQVGQSPLVGAFAEYLIWAVPLSELLIALLIIVPKWRLIGMYMAFGLMVLFSAYIYLILNHSAMVPCSCGGILEKMGWKEHLVFNLCFVALAVVAILLITTKTESKAKSTKRIVFHLSIIFLVSVGTMTGLYLASENVIHYSNSFIRRFLHSPATKSREMDLHFNSHYIAGVENDKLYLGSTTAQLNMAVLDSSLAARKDYRIDIDRKDLPFRGLSIRVRPPYFYVSDGTVPCFYTGKTNDWKAKFSRLNDEYFTLAEPIDSLSFAIRSQKRRSAESVLGTVHLRGKGPTQLRPSLLQKQKDGVFDTDGHLLYNSFLDRIIYLYAYRNEFIVATPELELDYRSHTIDTISHANLDIVDIKSRGAKKLGGIPIVVNYKCAVYKNLLFVHSGIPGRYEGSTMWRNASIIDVYDLMDKSYRLSFYIYNEKGKKLRDFVVDDSAFYGLIGERIVKYNLNEAITKYYKIND